MSKTYRVVQFNFDAPNTIVTTGLTKKQAQILCQQEKTSGEGWFWGYEKEKETK
jgi:hypothetical protein